MNKKSKLFLVLCFISSLLLGIVLSAILLPAKFILGSSYLSIFVIICALIMLSLVTYFSLSSFDIQEKTILFLTLPISIIISVTTFIVDYFIRAALQSLQNKIMSAGVPFGNIISLFDIKQMLNIWVLIALIIVIYNLPSIIFMLSKKEPQ